MDDQAARHSSDSSGKQAPFPRGESEAVWTYRGYRLHASDFTTAMVHLFRAEISRANVWRQRLDATTNWAVITTGAAISLSFTETDVAHLVLVLNMFLITIFLYIESRRYRHYELWSSRVRLMETDFFAAMLVPPFRPASDWAESLAENLLQPHYPISMLEAFGRRLRRNYFWLYLVLALAWLARISLVPRPAGSWAEILERASVGGIPGTVVIVTILGFVGVMLALAAATIGLQQATGEILPRFEFPGLPGDELARGLGKAGVWFRHSQRRRQFLAMVITDFGKRIADRILADMHRGVTEVEGRGMFTDRPHNVLLCALTVTEIPQLKELVKEEDPVAFMIVSPAHEVLGGGFSPLRPEGTEPG